MGREVRMVPANWEHPRYTEEEIGDSYWLRNRYKPLLIGPFSTELSEWEELKESWDKGLVKDYFGDTGYIPKNESQLNYSFEEYHGKRPDQKDYIPEFNSLSRTHYMMYENTSEGTPISPAFDTPQKLARWLVDNGATTFADYTTDYDTWLEMILGPGSSVASCLIVDGKLIDGVTAAVQYYNEDKE